MRKKVETEVNNILSLVSTSMDYGFDDDVFLDAMAEILDYNLSEKEIEAYAFFEYKQEGATEEDYTAIKTKLHIFKERYNL